MADTTRPFRKGQSFHPKKEQDPGESGSEHAELRKNELEKEQQLKAVRDRLYSRAQPQETPKRHAFSAPMSAQSVGGAPRATERIFGGRPRIQEEMFAPRSTFSRPTPPYTAAVPPVDVSPSESPPMPLVRSERKIMLKGYRVKTIAIAGVFFVVALVLSSSFLFFGQNTISGDNIAIDVQAPFAIGAGEELSLAVAVTNRNAIVVESATMIVEYPSGTQEVHTQVGGSGNELFQERVPLGSINPGEALQIPIKAKIFGEENEEKVVRISVEYRVHGSNATFFKEAAPLKLTINSSPVVLTIDGLKEVSSGQEVKLTLNLASNATTELKNLLIEAIYPFGFDFSESNPRPVKGQNLWSIESLSPAGKETIVIKGAMVGASEEERVFKFSVGVPSGRDRFNIASVLTTASTGVKLTDPFVGLTVTQNGSTDRTVSVGPGDSVSVSITFKNTLDHAIYDGAIVAVLEGNGFNESAVNVPQGFYISSTNTARWDKSHIPQLAELLPGEQETVHFTVLGASLDAVRTPQISFDVSVSGRRVSEERVPQELTNVESRTIRFESAASLSSYGLYSTSPFANTGPVPPRAEETTQYAIMLNAKNGSNELADAVATMTLPSYVTWLGATSGTGVFAYNAGTREVTWTIDAIGANSSANAAFQVAFLPSSSQIGTVPTLVSEQRLRATDRFTGTVVRSTADAITTHLPDDPNPAAQVGRVEPK